ncbi:hypothetical protein C8Q80DRAFT_753333 [Daedaleopsis nitida]|nr:hypothetical protein C8Q80DRAFT_753333 [Daedaleopsis nitida]
MPKDGLLHPHFGATVHADVLLQLALKQPAMHMHIPATLNADNLKTLPPECRGSILSGGTGLFPKRGERTGHSTRVGMGQHPGGFFSRVWMMMRGSVRLACLRDVGRILSSILRRQPETGLKTGSRWHPRDTLTQAPMC